MIDAAYDRDEVLRILIPMGWSTEQVSLALRAGFCCEYCDRDLLSSVHDYDSWQIDHILPLSRNGPDEFGNRAIACRTCSYLKRNALPDAHIDPLSDRDHALQEVRRMLDERRTRKQAQVEKLRRLFRRE